MGRQRRSPALGGRILVAASSVAATIALVGWMGRVSTAGSDPEGAPAEVIRRVVVVETRSPEPYIALKAAPAGQEVVVVTRPAQVIHRPAPAAIPGPVTAAPVAKSSGS
jgi:hypothetical protein